MPPAVDASMAQRTMDLQMPISVVGSRHLGVARLLFAALVLSTPLAVADRGHPRPRTCDGELLFNGICLPPTWPPHIAHSHKPLQPPYIATPPHVIDIDVGRQLFVDGFLVDDAHSSNISVTHHTPTYRDDVNPVLWPTAAWEGVTPGNDGLPANVTQAFASPISGGLFWDTSEGFYKVHLHKSIPNVTGICLISC